VRVALQDPEWQRVQHALRRVGRPDVSGRACGVVRVDSIAVWVQRGARGRIGASWLRAVDAPVDLARNLAGRRIHLVHAVRERRAASAHHAALHHGLNQRVAGLLQVVGHAGLRVQPHPARQLVGQEFAQRGQFLAGDFFQQRLGQRGRDIFGRHAAHGAAQALERVAQAELLADHLEGAVQARARGRISLALAPAAAVAVFLAEGLREHGAKHQSLAAGGRAANQRRDLLRNGRDRAFEHALRVVGRLAHRIGGAAGLAPHLRLAAGVGTDHFGGKLVHAQQTLLVALIALYGAAHQRMREKRVFVEFLACGEIEAAGFGPAARLERRVAHGVSAGERVGVGAVGTVAHQLARARLPARIHRVKRRRAVGGIGRRRHGVGAIDAERITGRHRRRGVLRVQGTCDVPAWAGSRSHLRTDFGRCAVPVGGDGAAIFGRDGNLAAGRGVRRHVFHDAGAVLFLGFVLCDLLW
jgi:hypothetical protein